MRPLEAVFEDATALFAEAAALLRRAHGIRQELEAATAPGMEETERLVHAATMAGIEAGLQQGLEAAQRSLKDALEATTGLEPAWLRKLLEGLGERPRTEGPATEGVRMLPSLGTGAMTSAVHGLAEVVLMVGDLQASLRFYQDVLRMQVISPDGAPARFLRVGPPVAAVPPQIVLVPRPADVPGLPADRRHRNLHHVGLEIGAADLQSERSRLEGLGFEVRTGQHPFLSVEAIYIDDPDGNEVELVAWTG
jgi:catechol 2,3-dioxygenase-like lactoylglutathione lyase family enzyme